jgi:N-acetylmuramoyl-L-alanine amidase
MSKLNNNNKLNYLVIHCTSTPEGRQVTKDDIIRWHTSPTHLGGRGWKRPGYSDIVYVDGSLVNILPFNTDDFVDLWEISNGVEGINGNSRHIVYAGGLDADAFKKEITLPKDTRNEFQKHTLEVYVNYTILRHPDIQILGHYQAPSGKHKACPSFNVPEWLREIGIPEKHIYPLTPQKQVA